MTLSLCLALVLLLPQGEEALTPSEELYRQATSLYDARLYQEALARFQQLSVAEPSSPLGCAAQYWSAECLYSLGRYGEAVQALQERGCDGVWDQGRARNRLAWSLFKLGELQGAAQAFDQASRLLEGDRRRLALYMAGEALLESGARAEARRFYEMVVEEFPGTGEAGQALFMVAESFYKEGRYLDAAPAYERFLETYPEHDYADDAVYGLAWAHFKQGRREQAAAEFNRLASKWPRSPLASEALFRLGEARYWAERYQEAIDSFQRVERGSDFAPAALYWTGWARFRLGEYRSAAEAFEGVRTEFPHSDLCPDAQFRAGECFLLGGDLHDACAAYRIVEDFYTDSELLDDAFYGLTQCNQALGMHDEVERYRQRLLAMRGSSFRPEVMFDIATERFNERRFRDASSRFLEMVRDYPAHALAPKAQLRGGMALFKADDFDGAREAFLRASALWPDSEEGREARYRAAWALFSEGEFSRAEREFLSIGREPGNPWGCDAFYRSGDCLYNRGLYAEATARYGEVLACDGASSSLMASAHNSIGWCHLESGDKLEAARAFSLVVREYPGTAHWEDSAYKLAELRLEMGDKDGAMEAFRRIASHKAGTLWGNAMYELAQLEAEAGDPEAALVWADRLSETSDPALRDEGRRVSIELLTELERYGEARRRCNEVLASTPTDEMARVAHHWLGRISWIRREWDEAVRSFALAAHGTDGRGDDYLWWARSLAMSGDRSGAQRAAEEAVSRAPDAAARRAVPLEMGRAYHDAGWDDEAVKELLKVVILYPAHAEARRALLLVATVYESMGDAAKARTTLEELIEKHPQTEEAAEARQRLRALGQ
jgi:TolA-binding protein